MEKMMSPFFLSCSWCDSFILAGKEDKHESPVEFKFWPDPTTDNGVSCP